MSPSSCSKQIMVQESLFSFLWSYSNQVAIVNNTKQTLYFRKLQKIYHLLYCVTNTYNYLKNLSQNIRELIYK